LDDDDESFMTELSDAGGDNVELFCVLFEFVLLVEFDSFLVDEDDDEGGDNVLSISS
jgi:hypothetical protein